MVEEEMGRNSKNQQQWVNVLLGKGYKKDLEFDDIYQVLPNDRAEVIGETVAEHWAQEVERCRIRDEKRKNKEIVTRPSLLKVVIRVFYFEYLMCGLIGFFEECILKIAQPMLLGYLIQHFSEKKFTLLETSMFGLGVVLTSVGLAFTHHIYFLGLTHIGMRVRVASSALIFRKAIKLSQSALADITVGQFVNLMSNDVSRFELAAFNCNHFWIGPAQTIIATGLLWVHFRWSCFAGLLALLLFIPFQGYMGKIFSRLRASTALMTDKRVRLMNEVINGIRVIKLYGWETPFTDRVAQCRKNEIRVIKKTSTLRAINTSMFFASSKVIIFFTLLAYVLSGNVLTSEKVFVSLALYNNIRLNMTLHLPGAIAAVAEALVSIRRIEDILLMEEKVTTSDTNDVNPSEPTLEDPKGVRMEHFCGKWNFTYEENTLEDITFSVGAGEIMAIIGHVGSGKGSIVQAILKELPANEGYVRVHGTLAYSAQEPWIFAGSVRDNIIFGKPYVAEWYDKVIEACALTRDLTLLPYGDRSLVGDRGTSLSGGQRSRVNLARAVYADADIYLLDDPLSAVDAEVGRHIFENCINGILMNKVRILVTHQLQFLNSLSHIILVNKGMIELEGTYDELIASGIDFTKLLTTKKALNIASNVGSPQHQSRAISDISLASGFSVRRDSYSLGESTLLGLTYTNNEIIAVMSQEGLVIGTPKAGELEKDNESSEFVPTLQEETTISGSVRWGLYYDYFRAGAHWCILFLLIISNVIAQVLLTASDYWLSVWTTNEERRTEYASKNRISESKVPSMQHSLLWFTIKTDRTIDISIYSGLVFGVFVTSIWRTVLFFRVSLRASINLHNAMLVGVMRAPMVFFEKNPVATIYDCGRILNRFSAAVGEMDDSLPPAFFYALGILLNVLGIIVLIGAVNPVLIAPAILLAIILYFLKSFYLHTARSVKRLEGIARSPVYSHLSTTMYGLATIRAFRAEKELIRQFDEHLNIHSSAWFLFLATSRWFGFWLDWISVFFIAAVTFSVLIQEADISGGPTVGLIISSAIQLSGMLQWGIRQSAEVQSQMISVEMVTQYKNLTPEAGLESKPGKKPPPDWPAKGVIVMYHVNLKYSEEARPILKDISCVVHGSEKVGIVGRTGAGKSSLLTVLFRMAEPTGEIFVDGINILEIGLHDLRLKLSIIPQEPVLFMGTLRTNLDPFNIYSDDKIWSVLEEVNLASEFKLMPTGLDWEVSEGGSNISLGQRQLFCLARAMLKQSKILILDEATANVDPETDIVIQNAIRTHFVDCTVLTIAHRLNTVMDCDRILVLDAGEIKEFDEPFYLIQDTESELYHLIQETGKDNAQNLFETARTAMMKRHSSAVPPTETVQVKVPSKTSAEDESK